MDPNSHDRIERAAEAMRLVAAEMKPYGPFSRNDYRLLAAAALAADTETEPPRAASRPGSKLTPAEFRHELNRLYAAYTAKGLMSDDLATAAKCSCLTMIKWIGGYARPDTPEAMESVLVAVSGGLT